MLSTYDFSDLVAVPGFGTGAVENWGMIEFSAPKILFDPNTTSDAFQQEVCMTVTHELSHQVWGESQVIV